MCQYWANTDLMLAASAQYRSSSGTLWHVNGKTYAFPYIGIAGINKIKCAV